MHITLARVEEQVAFDDDWWDFYKMFRKSKISDILLEYQHESSLERFYGHFDSKGCFSTQILPASPTGCQSIYQVIVEILP